jgi:Zn-dependent protease
MKGSMKLITIKGIIVYLHFTFLVFLAWMIGVFIFSGMQWMQLVWSLLFLLAVFACIVLHEYGHALVASDLGINAKKITLYPIGGIASIEKLPENSRQELLISIAGPFVSFCLAALLLLFSPQKLSFQSFTEMDGTLNATNFLYTLAIVNISLGVFNLIPAFPMDGGRILRALLALRYNYIKATAIAASVGKVIALLLIVAGLLSLNFVLALVGVFIIVFARSEESYLQLKTLVKGLRLKDVLLYDYNNIEADLGVREAANMLQSDQGKYFIVMHDGLPVGTLNRMEVMKAVSGQEYDKTVGDLMKENLIHLEGEMLVEEVLDQFSGNEERIYPVFDKERFLGVVSFQHIIEYLLINKASLEYNKARSLAELV